MIAEVNLFYKKKLQALDDRIDRYNIRDINAIFRYYILFGIILISSIYWIYNEFLR
mgnify:CR=1 FL=1